MLYLKQSLCSTAKKQGFVAFTVEVLDMLPKRAYSPKLYSSFNR